MQDFLAGADFAPLEATGHKQTDVVFEGAIFGVLEHTIKNICSELLVCHELKPCYTHET
jgi:hypothetical protein